MTDYKELIQALRNCDNYNAGVTTTGTLESEAADAIEQLIIDSEDYKEILFSCQEELKQAQEKCEEMEATLDTEIEYGNELKRKINSLKPYDYYTGTYIKALMEVENDN